jgi:hypothetical protein
VKRAGKFADSMSHAVACLVIRCRITILGRAALNIGSGEMVVTGRTSETGETEETVAVEGEGTARHAQSQFSSAR